MSQWPKDYFYFRVTSLSVPRNVLNQKQIHWNCKMERTLKLAVSQKRKGMEFSVARPHSVGYHPLPMQSLWPCLCMRREGKSFRTGLSHVYFENLMKATNTFQGKISTINKQNDHGYLQQGFTPSEVQGESLCFKRRLIKLHHLPSLENQ